MNKSTVSILMIFIALIFLQDSFAQKNEDSRDKAIIGSNEKDTNTVNAYIRLSKSNISNLQESISSGEKALDISKEIQWKEGIVLSYIAIGEIWKFYKDSPKALEYFIKALDFIAANPEVSPQVIAKVNVSLGENYASIKDFDKSLNYLNKGLEIYKTIKDKNGLANTFNKISDVYFQISVNLIDSSYIQKALESGQSAYDISSEIRDTDNVILSLENIAKSKSQLGYRDAARNFLLQALKLAEKTISTDDDPEVLNGIAMSYLLDNNTAEGLNYAKRSYDFASTAGTKIYILESARLLYELNMKKGNYQEASNYLMIMNKISGDIYDEEMKKQMQLTQIKVDLNNKEEIIKDDVRARNYMIIIFVVVILSVGAVTLTLNARNKALSKKNALIARQKEELSEMNVQKDKFFSILAHDLRNPFFPLINLSEIIANEYDDLSANERKEFAMDIHKSAKNIHRLMEDLLQWGQLQRGKFKISPQKIEARKVTDHIIEIMRSASAEKNINVSNLIHEDFSLTTDKNIFEFVTRNLLHNAIKFTNNGGLIKIEAVKEGGLSRFTVEDNGIGISEDRVSAIFKIDNPKTTRGTNDEKGTGLGLVVCREMVELCGGNIKVESAPGKGSRFIFTLRDFTL